MFALTVSKKSDTKPFFNLIQNGKRMVFYRPYVFGILVVLKKIGLSNTVTEKHMNDQRGGVDGMMEVRLYIISCFFLKPQKHLSLSNFAKSHCRFGMNKKIGCE